jgi:hypothetical protein
MAKTPTDDELLQTLPIAQRLRLHKLDAVAKDILLSMLRAEHETSAQAQVSWKGNLYRLAEGRE